MNKEFYTKIFNNFKSTSEEWGCDYASCLNHVKKDLPNVYEVFCRIYDTKDEREVYRCNPKIHESPNNIGELIYNMFPKEKSVFYDYFTMPQKNKYNNLKMCSWNKKILMEKCDIFIATLFFTEDFVKKSAQSNIVRRISDKKIIIYGEHVTLKICVYEKVAYYSINIRGVIMLTFKLSLACNYSQRV
ncbi:MAG: hypothetical protein N2749_03690 [Clostridia bacterium]|nr:hypothetical protein [Clostridia bacterium]